MRTEPAAGAARTLGVGAARQSKVNAVDSFIKENPLRTDGRTRVTGETQECSLTMIIGRYAHMARLMDMQVSGRLHESRAAIFPGPTGRCATGANRRDRRS